MFKERIMRYTFKELYMEACLEQAKKDTRICSPKMVQILDLKKWYFETRGQDEQG